MKIMNIVKIFLALIVFAGADISCKKLPDGFLSPLVRYEEDPIIIQKGRVKVSSALNFDGSTKPAKIKLVHIYDKATGAIVDDIFFKKYPIKVWTSLYNTQTDTTLELIAAKQKDVEITPIVINEVSGQVEANYTTFNIPAGEYEFDLEITNGAGTKFYPKIGQLQIVDAPPFEASPELGTPNNRMIKVGDENDIILATEPVITINRIADEPNKVILKFVDKNGVAFNPNAGEILHRPYAGNNPIPPFWQSLEEYAVKVEKFDDRMELTYGVTPFPLETRGPGFNFYYRIPASSFIMDDQATFPEGERSSNPRFVMRIYVPGLYEVEVKMPDMVHK